MRLASLAISCFILLGTAPAHDRQRADTCWLSIELVDAETGQPLPGLVQVHDADGHHVHLKQLLSRGIGINEDVAIHNWSILPKASRVNVPRQMLTIQSFHGLETELTEVVVDVRDREQAAVKIPLRRFYPTRRHGLQSANTHVHLQKVDRKQADRYLVEVAMGDGLDIVYVSYLERAGADVDYTTNKYTRGDLKRLSNAKVTFDHGEEHRHNFAGFGQGYGHVMLLNIPELVHPVSIGPGITKKGTDGLPLKAGIQIAHGMGATVIWCHNDWGLEDIPNWLMGRLHANNIFDGGTHGSYKHSFYRYLNAGLHVPFSTGTDWFIYDFSRVYVRNQRRLSSEKWLDLLSEGRSFITNGPLLELSVDGRPLGETLDLAQLGPVKIVASARGRTDFERIEIVRNGQVVHTAASRPHGGHFVAELEIDLQIAEPCWLALRTPPPSVGNDPELQTPTPLNEYGRELFSHTSPIFVNLAGRSVFQLAPARELLHEMEHSRQSIDKHGLFTDEVERRRVLVVYDEAIQKFGARLRDKAGAAGASD